MTENESYEGEDVILAPAPGVRLQLKPRARDLGGFFVRRYLPHAKQRKVGPFVFFDHMGPADFTPGDGINVRPHPHIGLATITYLYEGEIRHRDSLGVVQDIRPGEVNWMTAGSGIVHSERTSPENRESGQQLNGLQVWVALPEEAEEVDPEFFHYDATDIPELGNGETSLRVIAGTAFGATSPVKIYSPLFYVDATLPAGDNVILPTEYAERAIYVLSGSVSCRGLNIEAQDMVVFEPGEEIDLQAEAQSTLVMFGGDPISQRHMYWNFVSSSRERLEQAKQDWQAQRFPSVPDDEEFIPLPD